MREANTTAAVEGDAEVPGATLRYRLAGRSDTGRCVVFENGWGASFPYALWLERALAPYLRVLSYDRAGIGESRSAAPMTPLAFTRQLLALLQHVKIDQPVIVAGHSHGGLMAALHAAQAPSAIRSIVQIDPTPEFADTHIDRLVGVVVVFARLARLCVRLGLREPLFSATAADMPPEVAQRLLRSSCARSPASMRAAIDELKLLPAIRSAIANGATSCPRLVLSAAHTRPSQGRLQHWLGGDAGARRTLAAMQASHRRQAALNAASRWEALPHDHGSLITKEAGASDIAARLLAFDRGQEA